MSSTENTTDEATFETTSPTPYSTDKATLLRLQRVVKLLTLLWQKFRAHTWDLNIEKVGIDGNNICLHGIHRVFDEKTGRCLNPFPEELFKEEDRADLRAALLVLLTCDDVLWTFGWLFQSLLSGMDILSLSL